MPINGNEATIIELTALFIPADVSRIGPFCTNGGIRDWKLLERLSGLVHRSITETEELL
jgi:hypothetical protein